MRPVPSIAFEQCGVFTSRQAGAAGWTRSALRHATLAGDVVRLRVGAYQLADLSELDTHEQARWRHAAPAIGAVLMTPGALATGSTAAALRGIPLLFLPSRPCVCVAPGRTGDIARVHLHRCKPRPCTPATGEVACASTALTIIDLAREHGDTAGVVALDFALHTGMTNVSALLADLERCDRWPGVRRAREAILLADGRSESVLESRSRLKFTEFGLPAPEPQVRIGNEWGGFVARVDFYWDDFGVIGEADGAMKYDGTDPEPLINEKRRQDLLHDLDLGVVRWSNRDLSNYAPVAGRLRRAFARGQQRPRRERRWTVLPRL